MTLGCDIVEHAEPQLRPDQAETAEHEVLTRIPNFVVIAARRTKIAPALSSARS